MGSGSAWGPPKPPHRGAATRAVPPKASRWQVAPDPARHTHPREDAAAHDPPG